VPWGGATRGRAGCDHSGRKHHARVGRGCGPRTHLAAIGGILLAVAEGSDAGEVLDDPLGVDCLPRPGFSAGCRGGHEEAMENIMAASPA